MRSARPFVVSFAVLMLAEGCTQVEVRRSAPPPSQARLRPALESASRDYEPLAVAQVLELINSCRRSKGIEPLSVDRGLALVAQAAGQEYQRLGRGFERRVATRANSDLRSFSLVFARVAALVLFIEDLAQAEAALGPAMDAEMRFVGLSVAKSPPPTGERRGYAVVVTLGR